MKCDTCQHSTGETTGSDEYPANTYITRCGKGHWENGPEPESEHDKGDPWADCVDFLVKPTAT